MARKYAILENDRGFSLYRMKNGNFYSVNIFGEPYSEKHDGLNFKLGYFATFKEAINKEHEFINQKYIILYS